MNSSVYFHSSDCNSCLDDPGRAASSFNQCRTILDKALEQSNQLKQDSLSEEIEKFYDSLIEIEEDWKLVQT